MDLSTPGNTGLSGDARLGNLLNTGQGPMTKRSMKVVYITQSGWVVPHVSNLLLSLVTCFGVSVM